MRTAVMAGLVAMATLLGAGCKPAAGPGGVTGTPKPSVRIVAYINVSSGCQQATVDLLQQLALQNQGPLTLELVDFGDGGSGARQWQDSGYTCMTIEINGSPNVSFPVNGVAKTVTLQMPAGFLWTHEDLQAAVAAALAGKLGTVSPEEAAAAQPATKVKAKATVGPGTREGKPVARVLINGKPTIVLLLPEGDKSPQQRAQAAADVLNAWFSKPLKPSDLEAKPTSGGWALTVNGQLVVTATKADAEAMGVDPQKLADVWLGAVRHLVIALGTQPQTELAPPDQKSAPGA